jgi:hypothetical protein
MAPRQMSQDESMLRWMHAQLRERIEACEDAASSEGDGYTASAKQAISEEALWLSSLWTQLNQYMTTGETPNFAPVGINR